MAYCNYKDGLNFKWALAQQLLPHQGVGFGRKARDLIVRDPQKIIEKGRDLFILLARRYADRGRCKGFISPGENNILWVEVEQLEEIVENEVQNGNLSSVGGGVK